MTSAIVIDDHGGTRPWLVLVHGMSQDHRLFSAQVEAFRACYRILLVDLQGHGLASDIDGPYGHVAFTYHVRRALVEHGVKNAHFWGTHTGAAVGQILAADAPGLLRSLVIESPVLAESCARRRPCRRSQA